MYAARKWIVFYIDVSNDDVESTKPKTRGLIIYER